MRIRYLPRAHADLEAIYSYLANHNPQAAARVTLAIVDSIEGLVNHPEMGQLADEPGVRARLSAHHTYRIYYSIERDEIRILHIRHTARRPPATGEL